MQQHVSKYFTRIPPSPNQPLGWSQSQNRTFSEHGPVAHQT